MKTFHAVFEQGVFRPTEPVTLPEGTQVNVQAPDDALSLAGSSSSSLEEVYALLSERFESGHEDTAERHNEHQP